MHVVIRAVPPISIADAGPGLVAAKPLPSTRRVKPWAAPAYTLDGCSVRMFAPEEIVTFAMPDCEVSSLLMATISIALGVGAAPRAGYVPIALIPPQMPVAEHPAHCTCPTTFSFHV